MTDSSARTAAPRDVPPPRPVAPEPAPAGETGLGRAARAVAEAVSGLLGGGRDAAPGPAAAEPGGAASGEPGGPVGAGFGDLLAAVAPRLPIRDAARLRAAYPGATDAEIADALVARAARLTAGVGAATGGLSAAHRLVPASLLAVPLGLGAETVLTAAVEVVLIGELHELHGKPAPGDARARGAAYLSHWSAHQSGSGSTGLTSLLGAAGLRALHKRLGGKGPTAAPLFLGAAVAGRGNRRATESLAARVLRDLRSGS
jgi:hypothetical protein